MAFDVSWIFEAKDAFTPVAKKIQGSVVNLEKSMEKLGKQTIKMGKQTSRIGKGISMKIGVPLTALAGLSINTAAKFGQAMDTIAVKTGASAKQMENLKKQVLNLGMARGITPLDTINAQLELTKAGFEDINKVMALTPQILKLMQATGSDAASAANSMSAIMVVADGNTKEFNEDLDIMSKAYILGGLNAQDFATAIRYVGGSAKAVGWDMKDLAALLTTTSQMGMTASDTMMQLKMAIMKLERPSKQVNAILKKAGIEIYDPHTKKIKKLIPIIDQLNKAQKKWGERINMSALLGMLFGRSATELFQKLMQNRKMLVGYRKDMDKVGGTMDKLADIQIRGLAGQLRILHASFQVMQEAFMDDRAVSAVKGWIKSFTALIDKLGKLSPATKFFTDKMVALGIILGPTIVLIGKLIIGLGLLIVYGSKSAIAMYRLGKSVLFLNGGMASAVFWGLALGVAIDKLYAKYERFRKLFDRIWKATPGLQMFPGYGTLRAIREKALGSLESAVLGTPTAGTAKISPHPLSMQQQVAHALHININDKGKNVESIHSTSKNAKVTMNSTGLNMAYSRIY